MPINNPNRRHHQALDLNGFQQAATKQQAVGALRASYRKGINASRDFVRPHIFQDGSGEGGAGLAAFGMRQSEVCPYARQASVPVGSLADSPSNRWFALA